MVSVACYKQQQQQQQQQRQEEQEQEQEQQQCKKYTQEPVPFAFYRERNQRLWVLTRALNFF